VENIPGNLTRPGYGPRPATQAPRTAGLSASRAAVLELLHEADGPSSLAALSQATGLHPNTLREHLEALLARGLVRRFRAAPSGRGRPAWLYEVALAELGSTGSEYAGLAATLAAHIHRTSSDPGRDAVEAGSSWGHELARKAGHPEGPASVDARRKVVHLLDDVGFSPETDDEATTARLTRCPLLDTAKEFPDVVCGVHLGIVRGALEEYGADSSRTSLVPFAEPGACRLELASRSDRA
jgi:predicted ArsR family transcriptional regulator